MSETENRSKWYKNANQWEVDFIEKYGEKYGLIINPSKENNKFSPDLFILKSSISAYLKMLKEPFYTSDKVFNIPPQYCWTFNPSDLFEYSVKYSDNFGLFIWQKFEKSKMYGKEIFEIEAVYYVSLFELKKMIQKNSKIHHYVRRMNDTNGNSFGSYGVDLRKIHNLKP